MCAFHCGFRRLGLLRTQSEHKQARSAGDPLRHGARHDLPKRPRKLFAH
jgi:hypothetical protein